MKRKFNISFVIVRKYLITKTQEFQIKRKSTVEAAARLGYIALGLALLNPAIAAASAKREILSLDPPVHRRQRSSASPLSLV